LDEQPNGSQDRNPGNPASESEDNLATPDQVNLGGEKLQEQLREVFLSASQRLDGLDSSREDETIATFCLWRMSQEEAVKMQAIKLLESLPWRSEAVTHFLSLYKKDQDVERALRQFVGTHRVYSWHLANSLSALAEVAGPREVADICRSWLCDPTADWYLRTRAAEILSVVPGQHSFLVESLRCEQMKAGANVEATAVLRQYLALGAFEGCKSRRKQLALLQLIATDKSPLVKRLAVYLIQQPECKVNWQDLTACHGEMKEFSRLIVALGISPDAPKPCFIADTLKRMYGVTPSLSDLHPLFGADYGSAVFHLRQSVSAFHDNPNTYASSIHEFAHITIVRFYGTVLPAEGGLMESDYSHLIQRQPFTAKLPQGNTVWGKLGHLRNRAVHPFDRSTKSSSKKVTTKEAEDLLKGLGYALQELFDEWLKAWQATPA
jgi:hypothetical protein